jgi:hypothetical protein
MLLPSIVVLLLSWRYPRLRLDCNRNRLHREPPLPMHHQTANPLAGRMPVRPDQPIIAAEVVLDDGKAPGDAPVMAEAVVVGANAGQSSFAAASPEMSRAARIDEMRRRREELALQREERTAAREFQRAEREAQAAARRRDMQCMSNPERRNIQSQNSYCSIYSKGSRCSIFATSGYFCFFAMQSLIAVACIHGFNSIVSVNSFFSVACINSIFSVCSINSAFSVGCINSGWNICSIDCIWWWY